MDADAPSDHLRGRDALSTQVDSQRQTLSRGDFNRAFTKMRLP